MTIVDEVKSKIRPVEKEDRGKLLTISYSKLDLLKQCSMKYRLKYVEGKHSDKTSLALELGSILHKGLELKGRSVIAGEPIDLEHIRTVVLEGCNEKTDKGREKLRGVKELKKRYFEEWNEKSDFSYDNKIHLYLGQVLPSRMIDPDWTTIGVEVPFEFVYDNRCIVHGFIDRVDFSKDGRFIQIVDYKSSKKVFREEDIKTPLQMVIYDMACIFMYDIMPTYHEYDFILLDQKQTTEDGVCTPRHMARGMKKIDSLLDKIDEMEKSKIYPPSPSPLCYWCNYASKNYTPNADIRWGGRCQYHSLWTPDMKTFKVNKEYVPGEEKEQRKLVF